MERDISGAWVLVEDGFEERRVSRLSLTVTESGIHGRLRMPGGEMAPLSGQVSGETLVLEAVSGDAIRGRRTYRGRVEGDTLAGQVTWNDLTYGWTARRAATRPVHLAPQVHTFEPTTYHRVVSPDTPPALRLFAGDTVRTSTVDAAGVDAHSVTRVLGGNPLTGPFFVEDALPGDTLVVCLKQVRLNRSWARSGCGIIPSALVPDVVARGDRQLQAGRQWRLNRDAGVAVLDPAPAALAQFSVALRPMLGYIGVAPEGRRVVTSRDAGTFGGNLDLNAIREGATVYLPVYQPGALLFIGDGHAAQGEGELTGDALETSLDVEFSVDVLPGVDCGVPRVDDRDYAMTVGVAGSVDAALKLATTAATLALERQYGLTPAEASLVLGFTIEYAVAGLAAPQVGVVAKVPRRTLDQLRRRGGAAYPRGGAGS